MQLACLPFYCEIRLLIYTSQIISCLGFCWTVDTTKFHMLVLIATVKNTISKNWKSRGMNTKNGNTLSCCKSEYSYSYFYKYEMNLLEVFLCVMCSVNEKFKPVQKSKDKLHLLLTLCSYALCRWQPFKKYSHWWRQKMENPWGNTYLFSWGSCFHMKTS